MLKARSIRKTIIISLISSTIFLAFLKPILVFLWGILTHFSSLVYSGFVDSLYQSAALGHRNWLDFIVFTFIILAMFMTVFLYGFSRILKARRLTSLLRERTADGVSIPINKVTIVSSTRSNTLRIVAEISTSILLVFSFLYIIISTFTDLQLTTSFNQRLTVLAPYINDQEKELLESKWASMKCRKDFDTINIEMEIVAKKNHISLPENLLK